MATKLVDRLQHAWSAFTSTTARTIPDSSFVSYGARADKSRPFSGGPSRIIKPILTQIAIDAAGVEMKHVKVDEDGRYIEDIVSPLNHCFEVWPNLDQGPTQFRQDVIMTMLEEGVVAVVPVETTDNPEITGSFDVNLLRVGVVTDWAAKAVKVRIYDERRGISEEIWVSKKVAAIVENPLFEVMNAPNSTMQRLIHKLNQLDVTDDRLASGKLDIIIQLPYAIKSEARLREAKDRIAGLENQLAGSKNGIVYADATERITQLNRPSENNLLAQVEKLEQRMYSQMGLTEEIFFGTADESAMLNYHNRTVYPIVRAIQEEYKRKFLTKTAMTRGQSIQYFRSPFSLVPVSQLAEIADKFTRNAIMAPNEFRPIVGLRPVPDPEADELRNRNMPEVPDAEDAKEKPEKTQEPEEEPKKPESRREEQDEA